MTSRKARVCIISPEIVGPFKNGGVGTHCFYFSAFLSRQLQQDVTFIYTGRIDQHDEAYWQRWFQSELGLQFVWMGPQAAAKPAPEGLRSYYGDVARRVYDWLRQREFDVCHFQEMLGNGFRCFQAKRLGLAFENTVLTCTVHSSWEWICQAMQCFPQYGLEEMATKFMERYSIEHGDLLLSPSQYMLNWIKENQIPTPRHQYVLPYLFDPNLKPAGHRPAAGRLIFFGRLEVRKGLLLFLEALLHLDRQGAFSGRTIHITFLGKPGYTPDGGALKSIDKVRAQLSSTFRLAEQTDLGHLQAMEFLSRNNDALVVCPSLVDNSPYAIIESLQLGLNVIAANTGGIPELFESQARLFEPDAASLAAKIIAGLNHQLPPPAKRYSHEHSARLWTDFCQQTLPAFQKAMPRPAAPKSTPTRIFMAAGRSEANLLRSLESLTRQSHKNFTVTVFEDMARNGTPQPLLESRKFCAEQGWKWVESAASQGTPAEARSNDEFALFLMPGCVAQASLLETLVRGMEASGAETLACFAQVTDPSNGEHWFNYEPLGPCLEGGLLCNLFGAGCVIVKMKEVCGQDTDFPRLLQPSQTWAFLAKMAASGKFFDVVPQPLISMTAEDIAFSYTEANYPAQMDAIRNMARNLPAWVRYVLTNAVAAEQRNLALRQEIESKDREIRKISNFSLGKIVFKIKRETKRLGKQIQALYRKR